MFTLIFLFKFTQFTNRHIFEREKVSRTASKEPSTNKSLHFDHPNHDEESTALLPPLSNLQHPFPHESRPTPLPAMMWRFRPLPLSGRVPPRPRVCFPPLDFAGGGLINEPLLASDASPRCCRQLATPPSD
jgi:hypothetical protein